MELKDFVKACRKRARMTQKELSDKLKVYRETITAWETGNQTPTWEHLSQVAGHAHLRLEDCLVLPLDPSTQNEDDAALHVMREAISRGGDFRRHVIEQAEVLKRRAQLDDHSSRAHK
jgi:DNA-binding XRE family transcriptional regulator